MPVTYSQTGRLLSLTTPLGPDVLLLEKLVGQEAISELFRFHLDVLCKADHPVAFDRLLGHSATVTVLMADGKSRYFNGIVSRLAQGEQIVGVQGDATFTRYRLELVPKLWMFGLRTQSRIFQQMTVPDILKQVLTGLDISWELQGKYDSRDYCVQYRESDLAFASRLMEEEGIWYCFQFANGSHKMIVADTPQSHPPVPGPTTISYQPTTGGLHPDDRIFTWAKVQEVTSGKVTLWDHCFELPGQNLQANKPILATVKAGTVPHKLVVAGNDQLEVYEFPGRYAQRYDGVTPDGGDRAPDVQKIFQDNARTAGIRMQQETMPSLVICGQGNVRFLSAGCKFTLSDHYDANGDYVLTGVGHVASLTGVYTAPGSSAGKTMGFGQDVEGEEGDPYYLSSFRCIPIALPYRPTPRTPRPIIPGPQTATVVGPSGEEIFTDKYGRIKVQFNWDRDGQDDASSSCWLRVGTLWAGKRWGSIWIPRVGQEVIVAFEDGDPDRPIVVGSTYNANNMPPYTLPDNRTQSGIKSQSSLQGNEQTFNELRFEDKKGSEEIYFHAEKNFTREVENDDTLKVGFDKKDKGDQTIQIFNNQSLTVGAGETNAAEGNQTISVYKDRTTTIQTGNEVLDVKKGNRTVTVEQGNDTHDVQKGNRVVTVSEGSDTHTVSKGNRTVTVSEGSDTHTVSKSNRIVTVSEGNDTHTISKGNRVVEISMGNDTLTISQGNQTTQVKVGSSTTEAMQAITLKVGQNSITIDQSGITLAGMTIKVQGQAQVTVQGPITQVSADGMLQLKGGVTMIN